MINNQGNLKGFLYIRVNHPSKLSTEEHSQLTNFLFEYRRNRYNGKGNTYKHRIEEYLSKSNK